MRNSKRWSTAILTLATAFVLCGGPEMALAQQNPADAQQQQPSGSAQNANTQSADTQNTQTAQPSDQNNAQQNNAQAPDAQNQQSQSEQAVQQQQQQSRPGIIDPSKGPLTPAPTANPDEQQPTTEPQNLPDAPSSTQGAQPQLQPQTETPPQKTRPRSTQPVGVGTAQQAPTAGGAASKPAGAAIAPAKQKQYRSLLIKIGAIAAGGAALGAVYALSRGTKSTPPGAGR
jgi:hypothetical protein